MINSKDDSSPEQERKAPCQVRLETMGAAADGSTGWRACRGPVELNREQIADTGSRHAGSWSWLH